MKMQTKIPGLYYLGLTSDYKLKFEKNGQTYITEKHLGELRKDPAIRIVDKADSRSIGPKDVMIFRKGA